jgi:uncharacterized membrane protein YfhO
VLSSSVDGATIAVDAGAPARLVWSMAFDAGWRAELIGPDGRAQPLTVQRVGLVQGVDVPAGHTVVRFSYLPPGFDAGLVLSIASVAILVVVASAAAVVRRRRSGTGTDSTQLASLST